MDNKVEFLNQESITPEAVCKKVLENNPDKVAVIGLKNDGTFQILCSPMSLIEVCYMGGVVNWFVNGRMNLSDVKLNYPGPKDFKA